MQKLMKAMHKNEKGFTLVELMVVVVIIGILVAIAIPVYQNVTGNANRNAVEGNLRTIDGAIQMYGAEEGSFPTSTDGSDLVDEYLADWPAGPDTAVYTINVTGTTPFAEVTIEAADTWADPHNNNTAIRRSNLTW